MGNKVNLCWISIIVLILALLIFWKIFRKKIIFREVVTGGLVYLIARGYIYQALFTFAVQALGTESSTLLRGIVGAALDATILVSAYLVLYRLFYSKGNCAAYAISTSFGSSVFELIGSIGYTILSYALILQAVEQGNAADIFSAQGFDVATAETMIEYFSQISASNILLLMAQGIAVLLSQMMVAVLIYFAIEKNNRRMLICAFGVVFLCDITCLAVGAVNATAALLIFTVLLLGFLYYVLMTRDNVVGIAMNENKMI